MDCEDCGCPRAEQFCPACGQRTLTDAPTVRRIVGELMREAFQLDGRLPRTIRTLFWTPGMLATQYTVGQRTRQSSPVRLVMFSFLLLFVAVDVGGGLQAALDLVPGLTLRVGTIASARDPIELVEAREALAMRDLVNRISACLIAWPFIFAAGLEVVRPRKLYVHRLIFAAHLAVVGALVATVVVAIGNEALAAAGIAFLVIHLVLGIRRFHGLTWLRTLAIGAVAQVIAAVALAGILVIAALAADLLA